MLADRRDDAAVTLPPGHNILCRRPIGGRQILFRDGLIEHLIDRSYQLDRPRCPTSAAQLIDGRAPHADRSTPSSPKRRPTCTHSCSRLGTWLLIWAVSSCTRRFRVGCGSFEVSWLRCGGEVFAVNGSVDALMFLAQVEAPARVEVAAGDDGAELQDGLGAFESPSRARDIHSVLDDVPAGALDDPGGDGPAFVQRGGVVQVAVFVVQVAGGFVGAGALGGRVAVGGGAAADPGRDLPGFAAENLAGLGGDPFLGGGLALAEEGPGGLPEVFEDVDEVDDDRDRDAAPGGLGGDGLDLGVVAVDEDGPFALVLRVAALGLVEGGGDDGGDVVGDRCGQPLAPRLRLPRLSLPFGFAACAFFSRRFCAGVLMTSSGVRGTGTAS